MTETAIISSTVKLPQEERSVVNSGSQSPQHVETEVISGCPITNAASSKNSSGKDVPTSQRASTSSQPVSSPSPHACKRKASSSENRESGQRQMPGRKLQQPKRKKFEYGNYSKYYGYRYMGLNDDPRLKVLRREWFQGQTVLDIGCNAGHVTLFIAKHWAPRRIVGMDIDGGLIYAARQNIKNYLVDTQPIVAKDKNEDADTNTAGGEVSGNNTETETENNSGVCPGSQAPSHVPESPLVSTPLSQTPSEPLEKFPDNVCFVRANYVLDNDHLLVTQREEYSVILCLSVTKWIHLNWGDAGLKRLFHRVYKHLLPGGLFILEPQPWSSYARRKKLTDAIAKNYKSIQFTPDQFTSYLTAEVGFGSYELIGTPKSSSQGFERPIYVFHKDNSPSEQVA